MESDLTLRWYCPHSYMHMSPGQYSVMPRDLTIFTEVGWENSKIRRQDKIPEVLKKARIQSVRTLFELAQLTWAKMDWPSYKNVWWALPKKLFMENFRKEGALKMAKGNATKTPWKPIPTESLEQAARMEQSGITSSGKEQLSMKKRESVRLKESVKVKSMQRLTVEIPQTTPNHRKPPFSYMITVERGGNGCDIATIRAPIALKYASVGMEGSGKCYRRTRLKVWYDFDR